MQGFDIKSVKFKTPEESKLLTGEVVKGLDPASPFKSNSEIETDEYVQFPDGTTQRATGETHENGGVKMNLPDGTKVLSDNLTLTKSEVKTLSKDYDIKTSTSTTYAEALDKYCKSIGLKKLYEEQEELFETLKEQLEDKDIDKNTLEVNKEYLSKKIYENEIAKKPKESQKSDMFNVLFDMQESHKKPEQEEQKFKYGGVSKAAFNALCQKYGISPEHGEAMLKNGGIIPQYQDGHNHEEEPPPFSGTFNVGFTKNDLSDLMRDKQTATATGAYGKIGTAKTVDEALQNLYNNFPNEVKETLGANITVSPGGKVQFKGGTQLNKKNDLVLALQQKMDNKMKSSAQFIINNGNLFTPEQKESAKKYLNEETFVQGASGNEDKKIAIRDFDHKLGDFTSGRFLMSLDVVQPEERTKLDQLGIKTVGELLKSPDFNTLSPESQARVKALGDLGQADFFINEYKPAPVEAEPQAEPIKAPEEPFKEGEITQRAQVGKKKYPTLFFTPDQSVLPPSPQQAETMVSNRFQRIDPIRIGIEDTLRQISDSRDFVADQMETLPPTQRAAALSSLLAQTQSTENDAFLKTNIQNAQYQSQAELFNIGQAEKEDIYRANNLLNYEQRALLGRAKTEEDYRNYFDFNRKVALNNYMDQRDKNLLNSLFPDFQLNFTGTAVDYDPSNPNWQVQMDEYRRNAIQSGYGSLLQ